MKLGNLIFYVFWGLVIIGILIVLFRKMFSSEEKSDSELGLIAKNDSTISNNEAKPTSTEVEIEKAQNVESAASSIESNDETGKDSMRTAEGQAAYKLAGEIAETRAVHRWKELMDLYYTSKSPAAKVEVIGIASSLALASDILEWKMEVSLKANELKQLEKQEYPIEEESKSETGRAKKDDHNGKIVSEPIKHCEKCGAKTLRQSQFLDECGKAGLVIIDGNLFGGRNDQKKVEIYRKLENQKGFRCSACSGIYCMACLFSFAPAHSNGGKACFKCNGRFERFE